MEADALSMDFDRIAVYHGRSPHDVRQADAREQYEDCSDERAHHHGREAKRHLCVENY
jgi:hypothetical protein